MITACCDHKGRVRRSETTRKKFMVENLHLLIQDGNMVYINHFRSLHDWIHETSNEEYWNQLATHLLHPSTPLPERPEAWGPLPSWCVRRNTSSQRPANHDSDDDDNEDGSDNSHNGRNNNDNKSRGCQQPPPPSPQHVLPTHEPQPNSSPP